MSQCAVTWLVGKTWKSDISFRPIQPSFKMIYCTVTLQIPLLYCPLQYLPRNIRSSWHLTEWGGCHPTAAELEMLMDQDCRLLIISCASCSLPAWRKLVCVHSFLHIQKSVWSSLKRILIFSSSVIILDHLKIPDDFVFIFKSTWYKGEVHRLGL